MSPLNLTFNSAEVKYEKDPPRIPHERIYVAEVPRLRELRGIELPEFWQIRLQEPHYFFSWGISKDPPEIPHERIYVAEVPRLRELGGIERPELWQIRLQTPYYFFAGGISRDPPEIVKGEMRKTFVS